MSIKKIAAAALIFILPGLAPAADKKPAQPEILIEPAEAGQGEISIVTVKGVSGTVEGRFEGRKVYFNPSKDSLEITVNGTVLSRTVTVVKKEYEVQRLTLPRDMVELSPENEARVEREAKKLRALWPKESARAWDGNFINPREGKIQGAFGLRRIINNIPKNPHSGVDVDADAGAEVRTPNGGVVILVDDQFYSGLSVIVDHGQGLYTMFFHLSKILVTQGRPVKKGDVIGLVGSTGRSTGPHLHWGVRLQGARVNPQELIKLRLE